MKHAPRFLLLEFVLAVCAVFVLIGLGLQRGAAARDVARAEQLGDNLDTLRIAIERYQTDFEEYPLYLMGGDLAGWADWHAQFDEPSPDPEQPHNAWVIDPLLAYGYLTTYPANPFVDDPLTIPCDPRFGEFGTLMGNGVDDPLLFRTWIDPAQQYRRNLSRVELRRTQVGLARPLDNIQPWMMGGRRSVVLAGNTQVFQTVQTHWPGAFCYRGFQESSILRKGWTIDVPAEFNSYSDVNRYLLGVFGAPNDPGEDWIRLESHDPAGQQVYYGSPPPWTPLPYSYLFPLGIRSRPEMVVPRGLPEVAGGGDAFDGPYFPYNRRLQSYLDWSFQYGSPDGEPDGLVKVLGTPEDGRWPQ